MKQKFTDFNNLPEAIDNLLVEVEAIKLLLQDQKSVIEPRSKALNFLGAQNFITERGIPMSKSRLYKIVSSPSSNMIFHKAGGRLLFLSDELKNWCDEQIMHPKTKAVLINSVVRSAQKYQPVKNSRYEK